MNKENWDPIRNCFTPVLHNERSAFGRAPLRDVSKKYGRSEGRTNVTGSLLAINARNRGDRTSVRMR